MLPQYEERSFIQHELSIIGFLFQAFHLFALQLRDALFRCWKILRHGAVDLSDRLPYFIPDSIMNSGRGIGG